MRCIKCGRKANKGRRHPCRHCGGKVISVSNKMLRVCQLFAEAGFNVSRAEIGAYTAMGVGYNVTSICVYFDEVYPREVFVGLPEAFLYEDRQGGESRVRHNPHSSMYRALMQDEQTREQSMISLLAGFMDDKDIEAMQAVGKLLGGVHA